MSGLMRDVEQFIVDNYPVTVRDIYGKLPYADNSIRVAVSTLHSNKNKRVYVSGWVWQEYGHLIRALAEYSPGNRFDAKKPPRRTMADHRKRHRAKKRCRVNSVFMLGVPVDDRRVSRRERKDIKIEQAAAA